MAIKPEDRVEISSRFGSVTGRTVVSSASRPGIVFAAFYDAKLLVNRVVTDAVDPTSKEPEYKVTAVSVRRLDAREA